jgi:hypothetical protein
MILFPSGELVGAILNAPSYDIMDCRPSAIDARNESEGLYRNAMNDSLQLSDQASAPK